MLKCFEIRLTSFFEYVGVMVLQQLAQATQLTSSHTCLSTSFTVFNIPGLFFFPSSRKNLDNSFFFFSALRLYLAMLTFSIGMIDERAENKELLWLS